MKKYELTDETMEFLGKIIYRIRALKDFGDVKAGELGGWVQSERNLSHENNCWIYDDGVVCDNGVVYDQGKVREHGTVCGHGIIYDNGTVYDYGEVCGYGKVCGHSTVYEQGVIENQNSIITISNLGSRNDTTTFFKDKDNRIMVACGCFNGDIDEFLKAVEKTHGDNQYGKMYRMAAEMAKAQIYGNNNQ